MSKKCPTCGKRLPNGVQFCPDCGHSFNKAKIDIFSNGKIFLVLIAVVLVIGEGPGEEEDKQGLPFVGPAGQLLDKMLAAISLDRNKNCYIANIVKCRPPMNRDPSPLESQACRAFLETQIHILKPTMILAVGRVAAQNLLLTDESIGRLRGKFFELNNIPLMATYHPSALLRNVELKRPAWEDLKLFKSKLLELNPNYESTFN